MESAELFRIVDALYAISVHTDSSVEEIIDLITGNAVDEETAGELKRYYQEEY